MTEALLFILKVFAVAVSVLAIIVFWAAAKVYIQRNSQPDESETVRKFREAQRDRSK